MPLLAQNFGSWFFSLCVLILAGVGSWLVVGIGARLGANPKRAGRAATLLGLALMACAAVPLRYYSHALAFLLPLLLGLWCAWVLAGRERDGRTRLLWRCLAVGVMVLLVPGVTYSIMVARTIDAVRGLSLDEVRGISLERLDRPEERFTIEGDMETAEMLEGLRYAIPYQPEREEFERGYRASIETRGSPLVFEVYQGRTGRPDTCVLIFARQWRGISFVCGIYESEELFWALVTRYELRGWLDGALRGLE